MELPIIRDRSIQFRRTRSNADEHSVNIIDIIPMFKSSRPDFVRDEPFGENVKGLFI